jgi:hypothetical protein
LGFDARSSFHQARGVEQDHRHDHAIAAKRWAQSDGITGSTFNIGDPTPSNITVTPGTWTATSFTSQTAIPITISGAGCGTNQPTLTIISVNGGVASTNPAPTSFTDTQRS